MITSITFRLLAGADIDADQHVMIDEGTRLIIPVEDKSQTIGGARHAAKAGEYVEISPMFGIVASSSTIDFRPVEFMQRLDRLKTLEAEHAGRLN